MPRISRSAIVPYTAEQMYALVNDVEAYPDYLPWCRGVQVLARGDTHLTARVDLAKGPIRQSLTTSNVMEPGRRIEVRLVEGPFRHLAATWRFEPLGERGATVAYDMDFEVSRGGLIGMALTRLFDEIANSLVDAFCRRARTVHGDA